MMVALAVLAGTAVADPATDPAPPASPPAAPALTRRPIATPLLTFDELPPLPTPSLRLEALRVAGERADNDWRYPEPGPIASYMHGDWFLGFGYYRPRSTRSAVLHGTSMAATLAGEILMGTGTPLAGVGAMLAGATLDAAAADVDRDAEARGQAETTKKKKRKKH